MEIVPDLTKSNLSKNQIEYIQKKQHEYKLMAKKYGKLPKDWKSLIHDGFAECMRVLKPNGTLIFKWNESEIKASEVLSVIPFKPLFGHTTGRQSKTIWMCFMKREDDE